MLRITIETKPEQAGIKLEGRLAGPWVDELDRAWSRITKDGPRTNIGVDICGLTFIDVRGREMQKRMCGQGATFRAKGLTKQTVEEITRECEDSPKLA